MLDESTDHKRKIVIEVKRASVHHACKFCMSFSATERRH